MLEFCLASEWYDMISSPAVSVYKGYARVLPGKWYDMISSPARPGGKTRETETDRDRERQRETDRGRQTDRQTETKREETDRQR